MDKQTLADYIAQGLTYAQIANKIGRSYSYVSKLAREYEITVPRGKVTDAVLEEMHQLKDNGMSVSGIAKEMGLSYTCVRNNLTGPAEPEEAEEDGLEECTFAVERPPVTKVVEGGRVYTDLFQAIAGG